MNQNALLQRVQTTLEGRCSAQPNACALLMVSGGSDSTALAYLARDLLDAGWFSHVAIMHVNHLLRGKDADEDAAFVEQLAQTLGLPLYLYRIDVAAKAQEVGGNIEAIARAERYAAAEEALAKLCLSASLPLSEGLILTAHTADDRLENFYMRSIVGTGPGGFRSMRYRNGAVARPLLEVQREELRSYLDKRAESGKPCARDAQGALWREDATNAHTDRFRAFVRHEMVPVAKGRNAKLAEVLTRSMNLIADEDDMLEDMVDALEQRFVRWRRRDGEGDAAEALLCLLHPELGQEQVPLQRRLVLRVLKVYLGADARVDTASVDAVLAAWDGAQPKSGYVANIQGNLAVSANKRGVRVEPMEEFRRRRKRL